MNIRQPSGQFKPFPKPYPPSCPRRRLLARERARLLVASDPPIPPLDFHEIDRLARIIGDDLVRRRGLVVLPQHLRAAVAHAFEGGVAMPRMMLLPVAVRINPFDYVDGTR